MPNISIKQNALLVVFFLASSLSCIAFENGSCMNHDGSYDVPLRLLNRLIFMASRDGLLSTGYGISELSIQKAHAAFEPHLINYALEYAEPTVNVPKEDIGFLMLSCLANQNRNMQQNQIEQKKAEVAGFNPPYVFSVEDDCGPDQYAS